MTDDSRSTPFHRFHLAIVVTLVAFTGSLGLSVPAVATTDTITWSAGPADESGPDDRISLRHEVDPGSRISDAIHVTNTGTVAATFTIATGDGVVGSDGAFDIDDQSSERAGGWITVDGTDDGELTLGPDESRVLPVVIDVPDDALPGDHPAGIAVGVTQGQDVQVNYRVGVRLHLRVAGEIDAALGVSDVATSYSPSWIPFLPGDLTVDYVVTNEGNVRLGAVTTASAAGPWGVGAVASPPEAVTELLPGQSTARTVTVSAFPLLWLSGELTVTPVSVGEDNLTAPGPVAAGFSQLALGWTTLAVVVVLILGVVGGVLRRRRRRARASSMSGESAAQKPVFAEVR